jgi:type IV pilus assembly protein PilF
MRWLLMIALPALLVGCVTEYKGGRPEADPQAALERRVELARQYIGSGDWENAKRNLDLAQGIDDNSAIVYEAFGLVYQSTGEFELAEQSFKRALRLDPKLSRARNNYAAFLFSRGRFDEAAAEFRRVTEDSLYTARPLAFINLGNSLLQLGDKPGAEQALNRALSMDRRNPIALLEVATLRLDAGDAETANRYYGVYRTVVRRQPPRGLLLGYRIANELGDTEAASNYEFTLRNMYPESPEYRALVSGNPR